MDLVFRIWKKRLLADFVLRLSQHCARQQIWHSESGNAVRVNELTHCSEFGNVAFLN